MKKLGKTLVTIAVVILTGLPTLGFITAVVYREIMPQVLTWYTCLALITIVIFLWYIVIRFLIKFWSEIN